MAVVKKSKKKELFSVVLPKMFGGNEIAEIFVSNPDNLTGKKITFNLIEVFPNYNKYYTKLDFKINSLDGNKALTKFVGLETMRDYISRMVVRRVKRIDNVQDLVTKDGLHIRIKTLATVSRKSTSRIQKAVRKGINDLIVDLISRSSLEEFLNGIFNDQIKKGFIKELRTIYPLRNLSLEK